MTAELTVVCEETFDEIVRDSEYAIRTAIREAGAKLSSDATEKLRETINDFLVENVCYVED